MHYLRKDKYKIEHYASGVQKLSKKSFWSDAFVYCGFLQVWNTEHEIIFSKFTKALHDGLIF